MWNPSLRKNIRVADKKRTEDNLCLFVVLKGLCPPLSIPERSFQERNWVFRGIKIKLLTLITKKVPGLPGSHPYKVFDSHVFTGFRPPSDFVGLRFAHGIRHIQNEKINCSLRRMQKTPGTFVSRVSANLKTGG